MLDHTFDTPLIYIFILTTFYLQNIHIFKFYPNILSAEYKYFCLACLGHTLLFTTTWCSSPLNVFKLQQSEIRVGARSSKRKTVNVMRWKKKKAKSRQTERQTDNKCISAHICTHLHEWQWQLWRGLQLQMPHINISWCLCLTHCYSSNTLHYAF